MREYINDKRIGIRIRKDGVWINIQLPSYYAVGGYWKKDNVATTVYFGNDKQYFYLLPMNVPKINNTLQEIFNEIVLKYEEEKLSKNEMLDNNQKDNSNDNQK